MKRINKLILATLIVAVMLTCLFTMTSCKHKHAYTETVTAPTCTAEGYTTYTCECGDTYTDNKVAATGHTYENGICKACGLAEVHTHDYKTTVVRFPTTTTTGVKVITCAGCGETRTETIEAVTMTLPTISDVILGVLGSNSFSAEIAPESELALVRELNNYENNQGYKNFIAFNLAQVYVGGGDELTAYVKLNIGVASFILDDTVLPEDIEKPTEFDSVLTLELYVNGEDVSIAVGEDGEVNEMTAELSRAFYEGIAGMIGVTYDELVEMVYVAGVVENYLPIAEGVINAIASIQLPEVNADALEIVSAIAGSCVVSETQPDGSVVYSLDLTALAELVETYKDKTVAELIDAQYGEGTTASVLAFINSIPDKKIKDIATAVISFSENCGVSADQIYQLINFVVFSATDVDFSIEQEIATRYEMTLAQVVAELATQGNEEVDPAEVAANIKDQIQMISTQIAGFNIDQIVNIFANGDPNYIPDGAEEPVRPVSDTLAMLVAMVNQMATVDVHVNAEGVVDGVQATVNVDGVDYSLTYFDTLADGFSLVIKEGEYTLVSVVASYNQNGTVISVQAQLNTVYRDTDPETGDPIEELIPVADFVYNYDAELNVYTAAAHFGGVELTGSIGFITDSGNMVIDLTMNAGGEVTTLSFEVATAEDATVITGSFAGEIDSGSLYLRVSATGIDFTISTDACSCNVLELTITKDANGVITLLDFEVNVHLYDYDPETDSDVFGRCVDCLDVTYTKTESGTQFSVSYDDKFGGKYGTTLELNVSKAAIISASINLNVDGEDLIAASATVTPVAGGVDVTVNIDKLLLTTTSVVHGGESGVMPDNSDIGVELEPVGEGSDDFGVGDGEYIESDKVEVVTTTYLEALFTIKLRAGAVA